MKNMSKKAEKKLTKSQSYFPNSKKPSPTFFLARVVTGQNLTSESLSVVRAVSVVEDEGEKSYAQNRNSLSPKNHFLTLVPAHTVDIHLDFKKCTKSTKSGANKVTVTHRKN